MSKENSKNISNMVLAGAAILLLVGVIFYAWSLPPRISDKPAKDNCEVVVKEGTAAEVNNLGPNEVSITAENFEAEVIKTPGLVLVDAYAPWCPHCQKLAPVFSKIADDYVGKVKVGRMNADNQDPTKKANFDFAIKNGLEGYPTVWLYQDGKIVETFSGARDYCAIRDILNKYIK